MFTPHPRPTPRTDDPRFSGNSLLFPQTAGPSPSLAAKSPAGVPFTTPGFGLGSLPMDSLPRQSTGAPTNTLAAFSPAAVPTAFPRAAAAAASAAYQPAADERPPIFSCLDVGMSAAAPAPAAPAAAAAAAVPPSAPVGGTAAASGAAGAAPLDASGLWVTAFGFGSAGLLPSVLEELRPSGGELVQHRLGSGPWVHVRYADTRQQQQALAKNGTVLHGVMLGVIDGIHPAADALGAAAAAPALPAAAVPLRLVQQHRPVGAVLRAPPIAARDLGKAGWWTRLCEYVFGW